MKEEKVEIRLTLVAGGSQRVHLVALAATAGSDYGTGSASTIKNVKQITDVVD